MTASRENGLSDSLPRSSSSAASSSELVLGIPVGASSVRETVAIGSSSPVSLEGDEKAESVHTSTRSAPTDYVCPEVVEELFHHSAYRMRSIWHVAAAVDFLLQVDDIGGGPGAGPRQGIVGDIDGAARVRLQEGDCVPEAQRLPGGVGFGYDPPALPVPHI